MHAFILAGGFATRLWPLTEHRAKPLLPLVGKPIIEHILEKIPADVSVTVSTNAAFGDAFQAWKNTLGRANVQVHVEPVLNDDAKLGALRAVGDWIESTGIKEDVLLLTGDNYLGFDMKAFLDTARPDVPLVAGYDIRELAKASRFGTILTDADGKTIKAFEEKPKEPKSTLVSTGCSLIPASALGVLIDFAKKHPDNVGGIFEEFLRRGMPVDCFRFTEHWFDIGAFDSYLDATKTMVGTAVLLGKDAVVEGGECEGSVVIGAGSKVTDSTLRNTVLFEGCDIRECTLENCILDDRCVLRGVDLRNQMIRADTKIILPESGH